MGSSVEADGVLWEEESPDWELEESLAVVDPVDESPDDAVADPVDESPDDAVADPVDESPDDAVAEEVSSSILLLFPFLYMAF